MHHPIVIQFRLCQFCFELTGREVLSIAEKFCSFYTAVQCSGIVKSHFQWLKKKSRTWDQCCRLVLAALLLLSLGPSLDLRKKTRKVLSALALFLYHKPFSPQATPLLTTSLYPLYTIHEFLHCVPFLTLFLL